MATALRTPNSRSRGCATLNAGLYPFGVQVTDSYGNKATATTAATVNS
jgi:hypothetical protein